MMKKQVEHYEQFHGVEPESVEERRLWIPGKLVRLGRAVDVGYVILDGRSEKQPGQQYVHDHKEGVHVYRRARSNEQPDRTYKPVKTVTVLGGWLGCTYVDDRGNLREIKGSQRSRCTTPDGKRLYVVHLSRGVEYVIVGGGFRITDWMYD